MLEQTTMNNNPDQTGGDDAGTGILTQSREKTKKPALFKVLLLNDDYTPMEFVIEVLQKIFRMTMEDATRIMLHVHHKGVGICGVYTFDVAETKMVMVIDYARKNQHPLECTIEEA